jgi:hypothetical protein
MLITSLFAPVKATAMGGGGATASFSSPSVSFSSPSRSFSPPPVYYSPPPPPVYYSPPPPPIYYSPPPIIFSPPPSAYISPPSPPRTKAQIEAEEKAVEDFCDGAVKVAAVGAAGYVAYHTYSVLRSKASAEKPIGGRSQDSILAERREIVNNWPQKPFVNKELELRPPDGAWAGTYNEGSVKADIWYDFTFDYIDGTFTGSGHDLDGGFAVENGVFSGTTGRFMWTQRSTPDSPYPCVVECVASACKVKPDGLYGRPSSLDGNYVSDAGYQGHFSISPVA